jgi:hypothetical protein
VQRSKFEAFAVSGRLVSFLMLRKVCQRGSRNACNLPPFESSLINAWRQNLTSVRAFGFVSVLAAGHMRFV